MDDKVLLLGRMDDMQRTTVPLSPPKMGEGKTKSIWVRPSERLFPLLGADHGVPTASPGSETSSQQLPNDTTALQPLLPAEESPPSPSKEPTEYTITPDHPLANHPWWKARPYLLTVLCSASPVVTAQSLPHPSQQQEAMHMLAQRSLRTYNILNLRRGCQKQQGGFPNLEWDIFRELTPRFLDGELKFAQINWHAIGFKDKLRFEEEVDRAYEARNQALGELRGRVKGLERELEDRDAVVEWVKKERREEEYRMLVNLAVQAVEQVSGENARFRWTGMKRDESSPSRYDSVWSSSDDGVYGRRQSPVRYDSMWSRSSSEREREPESVRPHLRGGVQTTATWAEGTEIPGLCDVALK